jgi:hypothetical protein
MKKVIFIQRPAGQHTLRWGDATHAAVDISAATAVAISRAVQGDNGDLNSDTSETRVNPRLAIPRL